MKRKATIEEQMEMGLLLYFLGLVVVIMSTAITCNFFYSFFETMLGFALVVIGYRCRIKATQQKEFERHGK